MAKGKWRWWFQPKNFLDESPVMRPTATDPPWPFLVKRLQQPNASCPTNAMYISIHSSKNLHFTNLFSSQISELPPYKTKGHQQITPLRRKQTIFKQLVFFGKNPGHPWVLIHQEPSKAKVAEELPGTTGAGCGSWEWQNRLVWFGSKGSLCRNIFCMELPSETGGLKVSWGIMVITQLHLRIFSSFMQTQKERIFGMNISLDKAPYFLCSCGETLWDTLLILLLLITTIIIIIIITTIIVITIIMLKMESKKSGLWAYAILLQEKHP